MAQCRDAATGPVRAGAAGPRRRHSRARFRRGRAWPVRAGERLRLERQLDRAERSRTAGDGGGRPAPRQELEHQDGDHPRPERPALPALRPTGRVRKHRARLEARLRRDELRLARPPCQWVGRQPPEAVRRDPDRSHFLRSWSVPGTADGKRFLIRGLLGYAPPPAGAKDGRRPLLPTVVGAVLAVVAAALVVWRRRQRRARRPRGRRAPLARS